MRSWHQLVWMQEYELGDVDLAEINIACAKGLPGTEGIDFSTRLAAIQIMTVPPT